MAKRSKCLNAPIMPFQSLLPLDLRKSVGDGDLVSLGSCIASRTQASRRFVMDKLPLECEYEVMKSPKCSTHTNNG